MIFRTHLDKAKHYKRLWVVIYIGSFLRRAPTPLMGVGTILWISSAVIGIPIVHDYHHHTMCTGGLTQQEAVELAFTTWGDVVPVVQL